jgi:ADP-ribosyl-[dinitrogen reductase] hydrolase
MDNHIKNGIMGLCVADALGVPVEFSNRETLKKNPVIDMRGFGTYNQPAGTWSDDTSMTLCLMDSLTNRLDYDDLMKKFLAWLDESAYTPHGETFDVGNTTRVALRRFSEGKHPIECGGKTEYDNGNGSLMRVLPILFYLRAKYGSKFHKVDEAFDIIHNISSLTHAHKRSKIACGIYISIANQIIEKRDINLSVNLGLEEALGYYRRKPEFADELQFFRRLEGEHFEKLLENEIRSSGYVVDTLEAAIWCLRNTTSYKDCVLMAVNLGEDTDTVGAVAGGLAGLYYGYESIPKEWLDVIVKRENIESLCDSLSKSLKF